MRRTLSAKRRMSTPAFAVAALTLAWIIRGSAATAQPITPISHIEVISAK